MAAQAMLFYPGIAGDWRSSMRSVRSKSMAACAVVMLFAAGLAGCGGGGGGDSSPAASGTAKGTDTSTNTSTPATTTAVLADGNMHAACTGCGASDDSTYSGSGTGLWQALNTSAAAQNVPVSIKGLTGQNVTFVFTNESTSAQTVAALKLNPSVSAASSMSAVMRAQTEPNVATSGAGENAALSAIRDFNAHGWAAYTSNASNPSAAASSVARFSTAGTPSASVAYAIGAQRTFYYQDFSIRQTTLEQTATTSDGTTVNLWVENGELGASKVSPTLINTLLTRYAQAGGVYDMLTRIGGPLYGPNSHSELISGTGQPIDLVVMNFDHNNQPFGLLGYFWALNDFKTGSGQLAYSNQSISLYLDSETLYLGGAAGLQQITTTMAHESMHMQNFYRRAVLMGSQYAFDSWLEEMSAMMMEDWASTNLDPSYNAIRDLRFPTYLNYAGHGSYDCGLTNWTPFGTDCESYSVSGSFGGFLNRQLGLNFYKTLLYDKNQTDSLAILNDAIVQNRAGSSVQQELRHFAAAAAGLVPTTSAGVSNYLFAARSEGGFNLPAIDPSAYQSMRDLPSAVPSALPSLGNFPVLRPAVSGTFNETVQVPAGTTLSVVVD